MIPAFILALREGLEAALVIGLVLGILRRIQHTELIPQVWRGAAAAGLISLAAAILLNLLGARLEGQSEVIFEGTVVLLAAGVLTWMIFWMRRQSRNLKLNIEKDIQQAVQTNSAAGLFGLSFLAVLREGLELAFFLLAADLTSQPLLTLVGALVGLATAAILGWMLFASTLRLNVGSFFKVINLLLLVFAAGLVIHGVREFNEIGWIRPGIAQLWNTGFLINEGSPVGQILQSLFGYYAAPSLTQVIAYLGYYVVIGLGLRLSRPGKKKQVQIETT